MNKYKKTVQYMNSLFCSTNWGCRNLLYGDVALPLSDEGGGKIFDFDGGRDKIVTTPQSLRDSSLTRLPAQTALIQRPLDARALTRGAKNTRIKQFDKFKFVLHFFSFLNIKNYWFLWCFFLHLFSCCKIIITIF